MTIKKGLYTSFFILILLFAGASLLAIRDMDIIKTSADEISDVWLYGIDTMHRANDETNDYRVREYMHIVAEEEDGFVQTLESEMNEIREVFESYMADYESIITAEKEASQLAIIRSNWKEYLEVSDRLLDLSRRDLDDEAFELSLGESRVRFDELSSSIDTLINMNMEDAERIKAQNERQFQSTRRNLVVIAGAMILFSILVSYSITRYINTRIDALDTSIDRVAELDLRREEDSGAGDEIAIIQEHVYAMKDKLRDMVREIGENIHVLASNSDEVGTAISEVGDSIEAVANSTDDLAQGAGELAGSVQDGVVKLDELAITIDESVESSSIIKSSIERVEEANTEGVKHIENLEEVVGENGRISDRVVEQVNLLSENSESIGGVVESINSITEQINLLALNAAIEAARAGEDGRGFAVVAEEIRKLAGDAAESTKEIETIVFSVKEEVENTKRQIGESKLAIERAGVATADTKGAFLNIESQTGKIVSQLDVLMANIDRMNENKNELVRSMEGISSISEESAASTEEISASVEEQSASIEQIGRAVEEFKKVADVLEGEIDRFTVD